MRFGWPPAAYFKFDSSLFTPIPGKILGTPIITVYCLLDHVRLITETKTQIAKACWPGSSRTCGRGVPYVVPGHRPTYMKLWRPSSLEEMTRKDVLNASENERLAP